MIEQSYLETVRDDLQARVTGGTLLLNESISVPVQAAAISSHPITGLSDAIALQVQANNIAGLPVLTKVELRDSDGKFIARKSVNIDPGGAQFLSFSFIIEAKGGGS
ncbi:hypothetical protein G3578_07350 [Brevibacillus sp. SYP-B805]|uniref:hypothetical protein n=1 Tax=Brevibacillus sp. SYP-B805 TaxID=1578199 RepID=UPI0013EBB810|nr:hypothetical protein [Brevibacillus sp. SYP-B805]NGQ95000.1 hypothetical protein [Brevibacillus sp. SYP-B805]